MTNETQTHSGEHKSIPFGTRLKSAREAMGWERKDVAAQLRLNEKVILMMEKDRYPSDLPTTFIRGYIKAYGKLLQIPEYEVKKAIEPIKPKPSQQEVTPTAKPSAPVTSSNYFMQLFTYLIAFTLMGLVGVWWYSHNTQPQPQLTEPPILPEVAETAATPDETIPATPEVKAPGTNDSVTPIAGNKSAIFQKPHVPTTNNNTNQAAPSVLPVQPKSSAQAQEEDEEDEAPAPRASHRAPVEEIEDTVSADSEHPSSEETAD